MQPVLTSLYAQNPHVFLRLWILGWSRSRWEAQWIGALDCGLRLDGISDADLIRCDVHSACESVFTKCGSVPWSPCCGLTAMVRWCILHAKGKAFCVWPYSAATMSGWLQSHLRAPRRASGAPSKLTNAVGKILWIQCAVVCALITHWSNGVRERSQRPCGEPQLLFKSHPGCRPVHGFPLTCSSRRVARHCVAIYAPLD